MPTRSTPYATPERICASCWKPFHSARFRRLCWSCGKATARPRSGRRPEIRSMEDALALIASQLESATGTEAMLLELTRDALLCLRDQQQAQREQQAAPWKRAAV